MRPGISRTNVANVLALTAEIGHLASEILESTTEDDPMNRRANEIESAADAIEAFVCELAAIELPSAECDALRDEGFAHLAR